MRITLVVCVAAALITAARPASAEIGEINIAQQYGIAFAAFTVMSDQKLVEKHLRANGFPDTKVTYQRFSGASLMNDAILSGSTHFGSTGVSGLISLWAKAKGTKNEVRAAAAVIAEPELLNTRNPDIKSVRDFSDKDRIALPAPKVSIQAVILQMAVAETFGIGQHDKLDKLTVALPHPDAMTTMLSGKGELNSHFASPPFSLLELDHPGIRTVLSSYDVLGRHATSVLVFSGMRFYEENPRTFAAFMSAFNEANAFIKQDPKTAAEIYLRVTREKIPVDVIQGMLSDPEIQYTTTPRGVQKYLDFMFKVGTIKEKAKWEDLFFPDYHYPGGS